MGAYYPAPGKAAKPKLGFAGQSLLPVPDTGLTIALGAGLTGITSDHLELDAFAYNTPETFSLYTPGAVVAGPLGTWHNSRTNQKAGLVMIEANLQGAAAGTSVNAFAIQARDSGGATAQLALGAGSHFVLDKSYTANVAQAYTGGANTTIGTGYGSWFTPTQDLALTGVAGSFLVGGTNNPAAYPFTGTPLRATLLDAAGDVLAEVTVGSPGAFADVKFGFDSIVTLKAGQTYFLGFDIFGYTGNADPVSGEGYVALVVSSGGAAQAAPLAIAATAPGGGPAKVFTNYFGVQAPHFDTQGKTWTELFAAGDGNVGVANNAPFYNGDTVRLLGGQGYAAMAGDVTFSIVTTGAPAAGAGGSGLNLRALLAVTP